MATSENLTALNVSLPEPMRAFVDDQVARGGYTSASEYVRELLRQAQAAQQSQSRLEQLLLEGLDSGPPIEVDARYWKAKRAKVLARPSKKRRR